MFRRFFYFILEYLGIIEVIFHIKSSEVIVGIFLNYLFGKKQLKLVLGHLVDKVRMEFSIQRFIEKNLDIPVFVIKLVLPSEFFVNKVINVPVSAKSKIDNIVVSTIEGMGIFDIASLSYNYKIVGRYRVKDREYIKVLISAIRNSLLFEYLGYFRNLGIGVKGVFSSTICNINLFSEVSKGVGATAIIINKQTEVLSSIVSGKNIIKLEIIETTDKSVLENYIVSFLSEFIKERSMFLEKILLFYFDQDVVERVFDRVNVVTISGEFLPEYSFINQNFGYIDVISCANGMYIVDVLPKKEVKNLVVEMLLVRLSFVFTILSLIGGIFIFLTRDDVAKYSIIKRSIDMDIRSATPEVERYLKVIEVKRKVDEYEKYISSFYSKFSGKERYFVILYDVFRSIDKDTWLREVEVLPKVIKVKGFSATDSSFYITLKNLSEVNRFSKIRVISVGETALEGSKILKFELEVSL